MKLTLNIIKSSFKWRKSTCCTINLSGNHLTKVCYEINLIFFLVYCKRLDRIWRSNVSWFVSDVEYTFITMPFEWCTVVYSWASINPKTILLSDQKTFFECHYLLNRLSHWWIKNKGSILTIVVTHYHFSIVSANQNVTCFLWPSMTSECVWDLAPLFDVVDLSVSGRNNMVLVLFQVLECVVWTSKKELSSFDIARIPRNLESTTFGVDLSWNANWTSAQKSAFVPIPQQYLPVRRASQSNKNFFFSHTKSTTNKFLRFVLVHLINRIWETLPFFRAYYFKNSDQAFFIFCVALAHTNVASTVRKGDMSNGFSALSSYLKR